MPAEGRAIVLAGHHAQAATYRGSWSRAFSALAAVTTNHRRWPPFRHELRTAVCLIGLSKPFQAANATAHFVGLVAALEQEQGHVPSIGRGTDPRYRGDP
jgi:hypothetical protein